MDHISPAPLLDLQALIMDAPSEENILDRKAVKIDCADNSA